jgi:hypothetical protein
MTTPNLPPPPAPNLPHPAPATCPAPSPSLSDILALWQVQGKIEVIPLSAVAADLTLGRLAPLVEETN